MTRPIDAALARRDTTPQLVLSETERVGDARSHALCRVPLSLQLPLDRLLLNRPILGSLSCALRQRWMAWRPEEHWGVGAALQGRRHLLSRSAAHRFLSVAAVIALTLFWNVPSFAETAVATSQAAPVPARLAIPENGAYTGGYMDFGEYEDDVTQEKIDEFARRVGKGQAIVAFSNYWGRGPFPIEQAQIVANAGAVPLIFWNPWESQHDVRTSRFDIARIENGELDTYIDRWARDAVAFGKPLLVS
jgi:hypothetical protein